MWPDPADPKFKKLRYPGGTPTNKVVYLLTLGTCTIVLGGFHLISYLPFFHKKIDRLKEVSIAQEKNREVKEFLSDPLVQKALRSKEAEYEQNRRLELGLMFPK